jgi:hypothetical protein
VPREPDDGQADRQADGRRAAEIVALIRTGIARDGRYTPPWMAKLAHDSDEDIASIGVGTGDLRGADKKYATDDKLQAWIRNAPSIKPDTKMPTWDGVIDEYAPLMQYVRQLGREANELARN